MIRTEETFQDLTGITASAAITEYLFLEEVSSVNAKIATGTPGVRIVGVSQRGFASGEPIAAWAFGDVVRLKAGSALTLTTAAHHYLTTDTQGRAIPWTAALGLPKLARWIPGNANVATNGELIAQLLAPPASAYGVLSGTVTITSGNATADVSLPEEFDGATNVTLTPDRAEAALGQAAFSWPSADGTLRVTVAANASADTTYSYRVEL